MQADNIKYAKCNIYKCTCITYTIDFIEYNHRESIKTFLEFYCRQRFVIILQYYKMIRTTCIPLSYFTSCTLHFKQMYGLNGKVFEECRYSTECAWDSRNVRNRILIVRHKHLNCCTFLPLKAPICFAV
jgi:hypothetical protein